MADTGGTFLRFTVGGRGRSAAHMAYISRPGAVLDREGRCGFVLQGMPEDLTRAETFEEIRTGLTAFALVREEAETKGRTHYRVVISFEGREKTSHAAGLVREWLEGAFPDVRAVAFVHQNTDHTHAHVWIDARRPDGKKLHLAPHEYRRLDEAWNRIYCREKGRDEREHLAKKEERRHAGSRNIGRGRGEATPGRGAGNGAASPGERAIADALRADERAVRAARELRRELAAMDRGPERGERDSTLERDR
jgi:hypothetical protein